jgi:hypothetical protein
MSVQVPMKVFREYDGGPLELHIARFTWLTRRMRTERVRLGDDVSRKLSFKLQWVPQFWWLGVFWQKDGHHSYTWRVCLLPCLTIRIKLKSSSSGIFP